VVAVTEVVQTEFSVRELQRADAPAMRALFAHIFKKEMSQSLWDWKYARPQSATLGIWRGGELIAHYGGMGFDVSYKGTPGTAVQICDVMVNPSVRHAVRRQSPFFLATSAFLERYIGYANPWQIGYGFPSDRHMDLAAHLKLYAPVGRMWELHWDLAAPPRAPLLLTARSLDLAAFASRRRIIDELGAQQRADLAERIVVRKDAEWVEWRYLRHPQERYEVLLVTHRLSGKPIGACVLKLEPDRVLWMEVLAPLRHLPALAQVVRSAAWRMERRKVVLWCSEPDIGRFGSVADREPLPITIPANIWSPGPAPEEQHNRWWLLAGDTDFL
jgi:hypothetical protein